MSSVSRSTTPTPTPPPREGLNLTTLVIAALASAAAAIIVSRLWRTGTIMAAAMTPVIVAIVREMLDRPARRVSAIAARSAPRPLSRAARTVAPPPPEADAPPPPMTVSPELTARKVYGRRSVMNRGRWRLAIVTGLLAFAIAAAALTVPELLAGRSVVSRSKDTTVFGGARHATPKSHEPKTTTEKKQTGTDKQDTTKQDTTPQQPTTSTPTQPTPQATPTQPAPQQAPAQPAPAPAQPAPDQTQPAPEQQPAQPTP
jgi:hypothetical protein